MKIDIDTRDNELGKIALLRLSCLLRDERKLKCRSIRTLARKLKIKKKQIKKWEAGKASPSGIIMMAIAKHYGKAALERLHQLDFELQILKYERTISKSHSSSYIKLPAVIWAEKEQFRQTA